MAKTYTDEIFHILLNNPLVGLFIIQNGKIVFNNNAYKSITGYSSFVPANKIMDIIHEEDRPLISKIYFSRKNNTRITPPPILEFRICKRDGTIASLETYSKLITYKGATASLSVVIDVTKRKKMEELSVRNQNLLSLAQKLSHVGFWEWSIKNDTSLVSDEMYNIFGWDTRKKIPFETFIKSIHQEDRDIIRKRSFSDDKNEINFNSRFRIINPKLGVRYLKSYRFAVRNEAGKIIKMYGVLQDITDIQKNEKELEQKNAALRELTEQLSIEKNVIEENILKNIKDLVIPKIDRLKLSSTKRTASQLGLIKQDLASISSGFGKKISEPGARLSPRETEIADLVRNGLKNTDIAKTLNIAVRTVETIRKRIRRKLHLTSKKSNLATYLKNL